MEGAPQTDRTDGLTPQEIECLTRPAAQDMTRKLAEAAPVIAGVWSDLLTTDVEARWDEPAADQSAADQSAARVFDRAWRDAPCRVRWSVESGQLVIELESCLAAALIDRQLGAPSAAGAVRPALTGVERRLLGRAVAALAQQLDRHWAGRLQLGGTPQVETSPCDDTAPAAAAADFQVALLGARGRLRLSLSGELVQRLEPPTPPQQQVTAVLAALTLPRAELATLAVGDIIATDTPAEQELELLVEGRLCCRGVAGRAGARKAVRITSAVTHEAPTSAGSSGGARFPAPPLHRWA